jgi:hypothetical protein
MVLAAGSELIEDVRKAPEDVLSMLEPTIEVSTLMCKMGCSSHEDFLVSSTRIHTRLIEHERHIPH